jgi:hypothetical protein
MSENTAHFCMRASERVRALHMTACLASVGHYYCQLLGKVLLIARIPFEILVHIYILKARLL